MEKNKAFFTFLAIAFIGFSACKKQTVNAKQTSLQDYIAEKSELAISDELIACAAGIPEGFMGESQYPTSVFFYPVTGAHSFKYFEAKNIADSLNYEKYVAKELPSIPVFNGYLHRFKNTAFQGERMGIVTYITSGKLHVCTAIRLKTNVKPTEVLPQNVTVTTDSIHPLFEWADGSITENVIYFQVVSDSLNNLISGTYTYDKIWRFYDLSNVVLNIKDVQPAPVLMPNTNYKFTLMGVSEDNWVNIMAEVPFLTN
ncbi:MAG: hypothetical protein ACPGSO_07745 [Vicingaceae bacterium]